MFSKLTAASILATGALAQLEGLDLGPVGSALATAEPSAIPSIISSLQADGVSFPAGFPTDEASLEAIAADAAIYQNGQIPAGVFPTLSEAIQSAFPTAVVSDLPSILESASPEIESALAGVLPPGQADDVVEEGIDQLEAQLSAYSDFLPATMSLVELPGYLSSQAAGFGLVATPTGGAAAPEASGNGTAPGAGSGGAPQPTAPVAGAASGLSALTWTGALAGAVAGVVAFL